MLVTCFIYLSHTLPPPPHRRPTRVCVCVWMDKWYIFLFQKEIGGGVGTKLLMLLENPLSSPACVCECACMKFVCMHVCVCVCYGSNCTVIHTYRLYIHTKSWIKPKLFELEIEQVGVTFHLSGRARMNQSGMYIYLRICILMCILYMYVAFTSL